jgi:hypothetical protein
VTAVTDSLSLPPLKYHDSDIELAREKTMAQKPLSYVLGVVLAVAYPISAPSDRIHHRDVETGMSLSLLK